MEQAAGLALLNSESDTGKTYIRWKIPVRF